MNPPNQKSAPDLWALLTDDLAPQPHDAELDRRAVERALAGAEVTALPRSLPRRTGWIWIAAALSVAAVAWAIPRVMGSAAPIQNAGRARTPSAASPVPAPKTPIADSVTHDDPGVSGSAPAELDSQAADSNTADSAPSLAPERAPSAAQLFKRAGELRRKGANADALSVYRDLQSRFNASPEARLSLVIAGRLLLQSGENSEALAQFRRYLSTAGQATEDALVGSATACARLGRTAEERRIWRQLLSRFPESVHADRARDRLQVIDSAAIVQGIP